MIKKGKRIKSKDSIRFFEATLPLYEGKPYIDTRITALPLLRQGQAGQL